MNGAYCYTPPPTRCLFCPRCCAWTTHTRHRDEWRKLSWYECIACRGKIEHIVVMHPDKRQTAQEGD